MEKQLIFGFLPNAFDEDVPSGFAISFREDFQTDNCMNDNYPDEFYTMFQRWQELQIYEEMESVFSYPAGNEQMVKGYLENFYNIQQCPHFELYLREIAD